MLGHKLAQIYKDRFETWVTVRSAGTNLSQLGIVDPKRLLAGVDASRFDSLIQAVEHVHPEVVINCIGVIKQSPAIQDTLTAIEVNSIFPQRLATLCQVANARLIHISTDCVFSGRKGNYTEDDVSDAEDSYGRTKFLGEVAKSGCLTFRTSIIGRELNTSFGLVEWFLGQRDRRVKGFTKAIYTGFTTAGLATIIESVIVNHPKLEGVYNVSSNPVTKYDLLRILNHAFKTNITIEPDDSVVIDRSLDSSRFRNETEFKPKEWQEMINEMVQDPSPYERWRRTLCDPAQR
jgi:dTDP-4-dehydrorhamnose reductase